MLISLDWLREYVELPKSTDELTERLTLSGLNLESVSEVGRDVQVDLEVTSNRADCLGHIGIAREVSVLWGVPLHTPDPQPPTSTRPTSSLAQVRVDCPELCPRYIARVLRGIAIRPSPEWMSRRLQTIGIATINNVVDVTNYVMMECGQPLHAFDFARLEGAQIVVREALAGEKFIAIDHREYELSPGTCVIADARRSVALAGVMGGVETEVSAATTDLLIESAEFDPLSVRRTARQLNLQSPSSYRFERGVDRAGIDWASRRCCQLILELAGGELAEAAVDVGAPSRERPPITLRLAQIERLLGIVIPPTTVRRILSDLGNAEQSADAVRIVTIPPSWRADLTREVDLIEEVARIHGYDQIPEDSGVRMAASKRTPSDRVLDKLRSGMTACGYDEAMTLSAVEPSWIEAFPVWTSQPPLVTSTPVLRRADCLRQSLVPSLLAARRYNEKLSNDVIELFEIAHVYLPLGQEGAGATTEEIRPQKTRSTASHGQEPLAEEKRLLAMTSGGDLRDVKGVLETLLESLAPNADLVVEACQLPLLDPQQSCQIWLQQRDRREHLGYLGQLSPEGCSAFELRGSATVAEIDLGPLISSATLNSRVAPLSPYPPVTRDLNIVVDERVRWADVSRVSHDAGGALIESIEYQDTYRDAQRLGEGKKSLLFSIQLRSHQTTLTNQQADDVRDAIVAALGAQVGGQLRA